MVDLTNSLRHRIIPVLTVNKRQLVKTVKFKKPNYIGDPINAVRIFNEKEVDEIILLDIRASLDKREPNYELIEEICSEAFMPFAYGGGIKSLAEVDQLFSLGIEKVVLNSILFENINLVSEIAEKYGSQSIVASVDVQKNVFGGGYKLYSRSGSKKQKQALKEFVILLEGQGIGELFVNSIARDGTFAEYDLQLIQELSSYCTVPMIAAGGAKDTDSFQKAIASGASAAAAGSLFVYRGKERGVLINYPK